MQPDHKLTLYKNCKLMTNLRLQELEQASGGKLSDLGSPNGAALPDKGSRISSARPEFRLRYKKCAFTPSYLLSFRDGHPSLSGSIQLLTMPTLRCLSLSPVTRATLLGLMAGNGNKAAHRRGAKGANDRELTADEIEQARRLVKGNSFKGRV